MEFYKSIIIILNFIAICYIFYNLIILEKKLKKLDKELEDVKDNSCYYQTKINKSKFFKFIFDDITNKSTLTLDEQLQIAIENNDFEKAAEIRDLINKDKK